MNASSATISVLAGEQFACIKIAGRANFHSSLDFRNLVNELRGSGYKYFVLDLTGCVLMDSTFLGMLAGLGLKLGGNEGNSDDRAIELLNPNDRISELLENLGVLHLFRVTHGPIQLPAGVAVRDVDSPQASGDEVRHACLEAHETLMKINPENVARFKDVTQFLAENLDKNKGASADQRPDSRAKAERPKRS